MIFAFLQSQSLGNSLNHHDVSKITIIGIGLASDSKLRWHLWKYPIRAHEVVYAQFILRVPQCDSVPLMVICPWTRLLL